MGVNRTGSPPCDLCGDATAPTYLHARCHMTAPLQASFEDGILILRCYLPTCGRVVVRMRVTELIPEKDNQRT